MSNKLHDNWWMHGLLHAEQLVQKHGYDIVYDSFYHSEYKPDFKYENDCGHRDYLEHYSKNLKG